MTERVSQLSEAEFVHLWNAAGSFDEAVERVRGAAGKAPRWAVLARASGLRRKGVALKPHETGSRSRIP
jgi:hypothetical protein